MNPGSRDYQSTNYNLLSSKGNRRRITIINISMAQINMKIYSNARYILSDT